MTPRLLVLAMMSFADVSEVDADRLAIAAFQACHHRGCDPVELIAISWVESSWRINVPSSRAGACGVTQVLGGRYGNPSCDELQDWTLSMDRGAYWLIYFERHCEGDGLCCYNRGWTQLRSCSYARKVRRTEAALRRSAGL